MKEPSTNLVQVVDPSSLTHSSPQSPFAASSTPHPNPQPPKKMKGEWNSLLVFLLRQVEMKGHKKGEKNLPQPCDGCPPSLRGAQCALLSHLYGNEGTRPYLCTLPTFRRPLFCFKSLLHSRVPLSPSLSHSSTFSTHSPCACLSRAELDVIGFLFLFLFNLL